MPTVPAAEVAERFLLKINQPNNFQVLSWEIASYINTAQSQVWRRYVGNDKEKRSVNDSPRNADQDSLLNSEMLAPFRRLRGKKGDVLETDINGFLPRPNDLAMIATLSVFGEGDCSEELYLCEPVRDMEVSQRYFDAFDGPQWPGRRSLPGNVWTQNPIYTTETAGPGLVAGYRIHPRGKYSVQIRYLTFPTDIAISNQAGSAFAYEQSYSSSPAFQNTAADVDMLWDEAVVEEIITVAAGLFSQSTPDYGQYQSEMERANSQPN